MVHIITGTVRGYSLATTRAYERLFVVDILSGLYYHLSLCGWLFVGLTIFFGFRPFFDLGFDSDWWTIFSRSLLSTLITSVPTRRIRSWFDIRIFFRTVDHMVRLIVQIRIQMFWSGFNFSDVSPMNIIYISRFVIFEMNGEISKFLTLATDPMKRCCPTFDIEFSMNFVNIQIRCFGANRTFLCFLAHFVPIRICMKIF